MAATHRSITLRNCKHCKAPYNPLGVGKGNKGHCSLSCRFWCKVKIDSIEKCWVWLSSEHGAYGTFMLGGKVRKAHRVALYLVNRKWPGEAVRHICDNPPCCNPAHLIDGTQLENMADMKAKGRAKSVRGSKNNLAKVTEEDVALIRKERMSVREICARYGLGKSAANSIRNGTTWKHVDETQH